MVLSQPKLPKHAAQMFVTLIALHTSRLPSEGHSIMTTIKHGTIRNIQWEQKSEKSPFQNSKQEKLKRDLRLTL
jgi:hypothetical protein